MTEKKCLPKVPQLVGIWPVRVQAQVSLPHVSNSFHCPGLLIFFQTSQRHQLLHLLFPLPVDSDGLVEEEMLLLSAKPIHAKPSSSI